MTTDDVLEWRRRRGFVSPLQPLERGDWALMFSSRGVFEFLMNTDDALQACAFGVEINDELVLCRVVDCHPLMNALMVRAEVGARPGGFVDSSSTQPDHIRSVVFDFDKEVLQHGTPGQN